MTIEEIRELINIVNESGIAELEVQRGDNRVRIRRTRRESRAGFIAADSQPAAAAPATPPAPPPAPVATPKPPEPAENELLVKSPIVGTFYEASSPSNPPFVRVGETVQPGAVLCIIESMKLAW
jgi:acetyl-CoA carboxylase biotin carboxyl carrier protein